MKNILIFLLFIILAITSYFLITGKDIIPVEKEELKDFAIEDTASITQIFISNRDGEKTLLKRNKNNVWYVGDKFAARPDGIYLILKTIHDIKVQQNVSVKRLPRVLNRIATIGTKVEIYLNDETAPEKVWYIGDATGARVGTYMLLEKDGIKSSKPFVTHLLMENGSLSSRFFANETLWRDRIVFQSNPRNLKSIEINHSSDTMVSFKINRTDTSKFEIKNLETGQVINLPSEKGISYFKLFKSIYYEYIDANTKQVELDSIYNSPFRHQIKISFLNGENFLLKTFNIPVLAGSTLRGKPIDYHPERMYLFSSYMSKEDYPIVQNLTFDPLTPSFESFTSSTNVEK